MNNDSFLAVLGRQAEISLAELESLFANVKKISPELAEFGLAENSDNSLLLHEGLPDLRRLGGSQKFAQAITSNIRDFVLDWGAAQPEGKLTLAVSDYTPSANPFRTQGEALKLKKILAKSGRNVRVLPNKTVTISSATSFHNHMWAPWPCTVST